MSNVVYLIFYKRAPIWEENLINTLAALAQGSDFCHVEIALGDDVNASGQMVNVCRIFNDDLVEITRRTGRNPRNSYIQLGVSALQLDRMMQFANNQKGKPFSKNGMMRSLICPRKSNYKNFFCAELTAAILQKGGLLDEKENPGAATPSSLYKLYSQIGTMAANPSKLVNVNHNQNIKKETSHFYLRRDSPSGFNLGLKGVFSQSKSHKNSYISLDPHNNNNNNKRGSFQIVR